MSFELEVHQFEPKLFDSDTNINYILEQSDKSKADVVVFPELAASGYFYLDKSELSIKRIYELKNEILNIADRDKKCIIFGYPEQEAENFYNSAFIALANNFSGTYRKVHLFYREKFIFTKGNLGYKNFVLRKEEETLNIGIMICYDWRFPEVARELMLKGSDVIINIANLVTDLWYDVMKARAIENKVYFAVCNRIGTETRNIDGADEVLEFKGKSVIYDVFGKTLSEAPAFDKSVITAVIDPKLARDKWMNKFNNIITDME